MGFSRELRYDVLVGEITLSVRLWKRPQVREAVATGSAPPAVLSHKKTKEKK